jgi:malate synthase
MTPTREPQPGSPAGASPEPPTRASGSNAGGSPAAAGSRHALAPLAPGVEIHAPAWTDAARRVLVPGAVDLLARLHRDLEGERQTLLAARRDRQAAWDAGAVPGYLEGEVAEQARGAWKVASLPADLLLRRVEITGPANSARMVVNMLSRGADGQRADAAMLDFEDAMKPAWDHVIAAVANVAAAARCTLSDLRPAAPGQPEKLYRLDPDDMPLLMVRGRGLHLDESNLRVDGSPISGGLLDLALCAFHSAAALLERGKTPKYYVPKCEHHLEARWWDRFFTAVEESLALPAGCMRVTMLIETLPAAFQVEEILWELRGRAAGCNVGRWDKIFSDIKVLKEHSDRVLADRASISLNRPWMKEYARRLIRVCHRHGAFGMGGMAAFTPGRSGELRAEQTRKVVEDKRFEAGLGHDGCWVSHPYFTGPAMSAFTRPNQLDVIPEMEEQPDLLPQGTGPRTLAGLRKNLRVGIAYTKGWNDGLGVVAWDDLMEDLATLEISRAQTWQWLRHGIALEDPERPGDGTGERVTRELVARCFREELDRIAAELRAAAADGAGSPGSPDTAAEIERFSRAAAEAEAIFTEPRLRPFLADRSELAGGGGGAEPRPHT